jgi:hypothetical protein
VSHPIGRRIVGLLLLAVTVPQMFGCQSTHYVPYSGATPAPKIFGVTTVTGDSVEFKPVGMIVSKDTLYANTARGQVVYPMSDIKEVWIREPDTGRTVVFVVVLIGGLAAAFVFGSHFLTVKQPGY